MSIWSNREGSWIYVQKVRNRKGLPVQISPGTFVVLISNCSVKNYFNRHFDRMIVPNYVEDHTLIRENSFFFSIIWQRKSLHRRILLVTLKHLRSKFCCHRTKEKLRFSQINAAPTPRACRGQRSRLLLLLLYYSRPRDE